MRKRFYLFALMIALPASLFAAYQSSSKAGAGKAQPAKPAAVAASEHVTVAAAELQWTPMFLGIERAVVSGDPNAPGPFVMRLRAKTGATVPAHWHPADENVTVLAGTLKLGLGDKFDPKALHAMTAGAYGFMPKNTRHFGTFAPGSVIQIHGAGPFVLNFVNPADDPRKPATK